MTAFPTTDEHRINERIRAREVRLVDPDGKQLGIKPLPDALAIARDMDLDLVEVAPQASPPVCRIMDYNKFKFDEAQRARESRRKSTNASLKEMKYRLKIGPGDFETKTRKVAGFLAEGHKVKITIMFRGREVERPQFGQDILNRIAETVSTVGKVESMPRLDGRNMVMVLAPDKRAQAAAHAAKGHAAGDAEGAPAADAAGPAPAPESQNGRRPAAAPPAAAQAPAAQAPAAEAPAATAPATPAPAATAPATPPATAPATPAPPATAPATPAPATQTPRST
ncbi:MAG TPA: translation initiation factor IF-3 [Acidimicrobiales bacterium]|nr:translation initiation factor IF-3 [Acidimicrobiales bacterium]